MEPITSATALVAAETAGEAVAKETFLQSLEIGRKAAEWNGTNELQPSLETMESLNGLLDSEKYRKLNEFRELSQSSPEAVQQAFNDINLKGQMGESLMEANLMQYGEVRSQIPVQLEGAATGNRIDLQLADSNATLKQVEMNVEGGQIKLEYNYDLLKGESASFEVKNGGLPYLRQEQLSGDLLQQIEAGKQLSDHSFVIINEDTAKAMLSNPNQAAEIISAIQESGGKLIVGLPSQSVQMALFMS